MIKSTLTLLGSLLLAASLLYIAFPRAAHAEGGTSDNLIGQGREITIIDGALVCMEIVDGFTLCTDHGRHPALCRYSKADGTKCKFLPEPVIAEEDWAGNDLPVTGCHNSMLECLSPPSGRAVPNWRNYGGNTQAVPDISIEAHTACFALADGKLACANSSLPIANAVRECQPSKIRWGCAPPSCIDPQTGLTRMEDPEFHCDGRDFGREEHR